jgi:hypothetical protein
MLDPNPRYYQMNQRFPSFLMNRMFPIQKFRLNQRCPIQKFRLNQSYQNFLTNQMIPKNQMCRLFLMNRSCLMFRSNQKCPSQRFHLNPRFLSFRSCRLFPMNQMFLMFRSSQMFPIQRFHLNQNYQMCQMFLALHQMKLQSTNRRP